MSKKAILLALMCSLLLAVSGCARPTTPNETKPLSGTLTISTYYDGAIEHHAQEFMKLHPDVKVEVHIAGSEADRFETLEKYGTRIATELMSRRATDLVDLAHFSAFRYAKSGLLCDLYSFMDNDPDFDKNDYYTNIFEAKEYNGALYTLPFYFTYDMMYTSRPLSEQAGVHYSALDYEKMLSLHKTVATQTLGSAAPRLMPGLVKESFFRYEFPAFYDTRTGEAWFDSPEFVEFLQDTDWLETPYDPVNQDWDMNRIAGDDEFMKSDYLFCKLDMTAIDVFNLLIDYQNVHPPVPLLSSKGDAQFITRMAEYAIPANCSNKELAWEFLKFCVEEKTPPNAADKRESVAYVLQYNAWVPINIANFYHTFRLQCEADMNNIGDSVAWKPGSPEKMIKQTLDQIHSWNMQRNRPVSETELWFLINSDLENFYYYDLATAEETAAIIQNKVMTYLNE